MSKIQVDALKELAPQLKAGDFLELSGEIYTARDAAHQRLLDEVNKSGKLPFNLENSVIFYAGPTPPLRGKVFGAVGPTTASRMDFAAPSLYKHGVIASIGKGSRSREVLKACQKYQTLYLIAAGGAAAELASHVISSELIAYPELGTEAIRKIEVQDFPVFVAIDTQGNDILAQVAKAARDSLEAGK
ncbi:MAG: FumA C-terminus/TtdB family hydratase beta subunit [Coriobacteriia bacterium]|nr:FumA C-terminus/TtdB family hydratase beta subunit [Coriobacteriia bacterium]